MGLSPSGTGFEVLETVKFKSIWFLRFFACSFHWYKVCTHKVCSRDNAQLPFQSSYGSSFFLKMPVTFFRHP